MHSISTIMLPDPPTDTKDIILLFSQAEQYFC